MNKTPEKRAAELKGAPFTGYIAKREFSDVAAEGGLEDMVGVVK